MSLFNDRGTIHVTLPGTLQGAPPKGDDRTTRKRDEFGLPHFTPSQLESKHIRLLSGQISSVKDATSSAFLKWYLAQLQFITPNSQSFAHVKLTLFAGLDTSSIDMMARWYLLEELMHLPGYANASVKLFVEDEQEGAA
jgi:hypothetical protein